ncbi:hypothetical protein [Hymenobacter rubripertinctus]|uniref:hypothetical protein n=1 Tax=Hymenobacter rubripertinctus TaxID=2029981 RepID=UPI0015FFC59B|nr:hypothetical protein [Hymenobacter rubripertinctus]
MKPDTKLLIIKVIHTMVWGFFVAVIGYVLYCGITDQITWRTWVACALVVAEGGVLLLFRRHCPLTLLARRYSHSRRDNFDIFLPNWLARHNQLIFTSIYVLALLLLGYRLGQQVGGSTRKAHHARLGGHDNPVVQQAFLRNKELLNGGRNGGVGNRLHCGGLAVRIQGLHE